MAKVDRGVSVREAAPALLDFSSALSMIFGGCCVNVFVYEQLLLMNPTIGSALTFSQMLFITLQSLPTFLHRPHGHWMPRLKPRNIPLREWMFQVAVMSSASLLNNWVYAYKVPMTLMIVFRSASLAVSMLLGKVIMKRIYSGRQVFSVVLVSFGVVLATIYRPSSSQSLGKPSKTDDIDLVDMSKYSTGIAMMTTSLCLSAVHGLLQERTYRKYGPHWQEAVFYNHALSLPIFLFLASDVQQGLLSLSRNNYIPSTTMSFFILGLNLVSQLLCVSGVNKLSSKTSSVSTNLVLTVRKAISLLFSIWWFGNGYNLELGIGSFLVFAGGTLFTLSGQPQPNKRDDKSKIE
ncbi:UAA transporter [Flagelloscypha sp. PMI_526]|nr:UAA transporter [Flagelloscypha sp. PMI_526]